MSMPRDLSNISTFSSTVSAAPGSSSTFSKSSKPKKTVFNVLKDPEAPKRPLSRYLVFAREEREKVVAEMGEMPVGAVWKEMDRRWGLLDQQSKERFETAYQKDKTRYEEEMKNYQPSQEFLELKAKSLKEQATMMSETGVDEYFSIVLSSWGKDNGENPNPNQAFEEEGEELKKYIEELMEFKRKEEMANKEGGDGDGDA